MKLNMIGAFLALSFFSTPSLSTEYIYRDLMANTIPSPRCESKADAKKSAERPYKLNHYGLEVHRLF